MPRVELPPYRWAFATLVVGTACLPLALASLWGLAAAAVALGFVVIPSLRWFEHRAASWREEVYRTGVEATGCVIDVEPPGAERRDHLVRVDFVAGGAVVRASVLGCPLARKGLGPGDEVVVIYAANRPSQCLVVGRVPPQIVDAIFED